MGSIHTHSPKWTDGGNQSQAPRLNKHVCYYGPKEMLLHLN